MADTKEKATEVVADEEATEEVVEEKDPMESEPFKLRVLKLMAELVAPKDSKNTFGKYNYRSTESITEALKPLCLKYRILPSMTEENSDDSVSKPWVKSIVTLTDVYSDESTTSEARVFVDMGRKGMSLEQMSGAALSYSRKYAWGGLLLIDDTKDPDTDEYQRASQRGSNTKTSNSTAKENKPVTGPGNIGDEVITEQEAKVVDGMLLPGQKKFFLDRYGVDSISKITKTQYAEIMKALKHREAELEAQGKAN